MTFTGKTKMFGIIKIVQKYNAFHFDYDINGCLDVNNITLIYLIEKYLSG